MLESSDEILADLLTGKVNVLVPDPNLVQNYQVYVYFEYSGMNDIEADNIRGPFILSVGCQNNIITPSTISNIALNADTNTYQIPFDSGTNGLFEVRLEEFTTSNQLCQISSYKLSSSRNVYQPH